MIKVKKILVLYQGALGDTIAKQVCTSLSKFANSNSDNILTTFRLSYGKNGAETVYDKLIETVEACDYAIAILTFDGRPASLAGNIWMEIGFWCALKPKENLIICKQINSKVRMTSNILGVIENKFECKSGRSKKYINTASETIVNCFLRFLKNKSNSEYQQKTNTGRNDRLGKIKNTILDGSDIIEDVAQLFVCNKTGRPRNCEKKSILFQFSSELMRMGKSAWEHNFIQYKLSEIGSVLNLIVETFSRERSEYSDGVVVLKDRAKYLRKLRERIEELLFFCMNNIHRHNWPDSLEPSEKLKKYIGYRLEIAEVFFENTNHRVPDGFSKSCEVLKRKVEDDFIPWLKKFPNDEAQYRNETFIPEGKDIAVWSDLVPLGDIATQLSEIFSMMGDFFFIETRKVFKKERSKISNSEEVIDILSNLQDNLPHNISAIIPDIWPRNVKLKDDM